MPFNRRQFVKIAGGLSGAFIKSVPLSAGAKNRQTTGWRTFEVTTQIEVLKPAGVTRIWAPVALVQNTPFQKTVRNTLQGEAGTARLVRTAGGLDLIAAVFPAGTKPVHTLVSEVKTRDWTVDLAAQYSRDRHNQRGLDGWLQPTKMLPTDGIVKTRAEEITKGASTDVAKAHAIYQWIVENTYRNPKTRGCGLGDIRFMLESGDLGGKCADLNALYVGLARAVGLPARDVYGIRVAPSDLGCKSLGISSNDATKAQHCRAEVFLNGYGWVPVDPADVRKVVLEEPPGHRSLQDDLVKETRRRLFGSWEMNWIAYNYAQDVALPGARGPSLHFLMYPQAETAEGRLDALDPNDFRYQITSREGSA